MKKKEGKKYKIEFTKASLLLWSSLFLLFIVWVFMLGVFAGKGFLPKNTSEPLKKKEKVQTEDRKEPELHFYKKLTSSSSSTHQEIKKNKTFSKKICYCVQVAAFFKEKDAQNMTERLKKKGYNAYYSIVKKDNKIYYRVRCGRFENRKKAYLLRERLIKTEKIKGIIVRCR